jgi:hypothetical protein
MKITGQQLMWLFLIVKDSLPLLIKMGGLGPEQRAALLTSIINQQSSELVDLGVGVGVKVEEPCEGV